MKGFTIVGKSLLSALWEAERVSQAVRPRGHGHVAAQARPGRQPRAVSHPFVIASMHVCWVPRVSGTLLTPRR